MKRGHLAFLGRKDPSLFDARITRREADYTNLVLNSPTTPESGTASVRARPTVKHHIPSESSQGFAVPTPRVPVLPPINSPKINGADYGNPLSNGLVEEDVFIPSPPSMAPPPPPGTFVLPPPDFLGYLSTAKVASHQPPAIPAPKPPVKGERSQRVINPPSVPPPKPLSTGSSSSASSTPISKPSPAKVPKHPNFAPPPPPTKTQPRTPPPKPKRFSSMSNLDSPPHSPAPPPPAQTPTQSTFNPQTTAKLYHVSNGSILSGYEEPDMRPKQMLLLEDSGSAKSVPMLDKLDRNGPRATGTKPLRKENIQSVCLSQPPLHEAKNGAYHKENLPSMAFAQPAEDVTYHQDRAQSLPLSQSPTPQVTTKTNAVAVSPNSDAMTPPQVPYQVPKKLQIGNRTSEDVQGRLGLNPKFNSVLDRKLRNLKDSESSASGEKTAASPLALLTAAKERDRFKGFASHQNGTLTCNQRTRSTKSEFSILPRSVSTSSLFYPDQFQVSPTSVNPTQRTKSATIARMGIQSTSSGPADTWTEPTSPVRQSDRITNGKPAVREEDKEVFGMPLLPPPPEFDDYDVTTEPPPSICPPDPPLRTAPQANLNSLPPAPLPKQSPIYINVPPKTHFQTKAKADPAQPPIYINVPPQMHFQTKTKADPAQPPIYINVPPKTHFQAKPKADSAQVQSPKSTSQATLMSILQKKMLEMDHRIYPTEEADDSAEDWGTPLSEDTKEAFLPKTSPQAKKERPHGITQTTTTQQQQPPPRQEIKKYQNTDSNGPPSSHQYGMTFRVRPGTKQPITLIRKGPS